MSEKITVIIPVYNTAQYLDRCISSVVRQTYNILEIILVDDGSTDNSYEICKRWAQRDSRIILLHKENGGQSSARNMALDIATGDYIAFVDSDDWIELDMYEECLRALENSGKDIAMCNCQNLLHNESDIFIDVIRDNIGSQLWRFLFPKYLWDGIRMPLGRYVQDTAVLHEVLYQKSIVIVDRELYHYYFDNPDNTSNAPKNKLKGVIDRSIVFALRYEWMREKQLDRESQMIILAKSISFFIGAMGLYCAKKD